MTDNENRSHNYDENGGPAFPYTLVKESTQYGAPILTEYHQGMSLRDAFAMAALQSTGISHWTYGYADRDTPAAVWADRAYLIADAMLARRKA